MYQRQSRNQAFSTPIRSIQSTSSGKVHRERSSYGPTVCLINKSVEKPSNDDDDKVKVFMLILEIQRLQYQLGRSKSSLTDKQVNEINLLKKQLAHLRGELQKSQAQKFEESERYNRVIYSQTTKMGEYEAQLNVITRKLREAQDSNDSLKDNMRNLQSQLSKLRAQNSRVNVSMMNSQTQLHRSMSRDRLIQMDLWRQKLLKYEQKINEQKNQINHYKEAYDKLKNTQYELKQRYDYEISRINGTNNDLRRTITNIKDENTQNNQIKFNEMETQLVKRERQNESLQKKIKQILKENEKIAERAENLDKTKYMLEKQLSEKVQLLKKKENEDMDSLSKLKKKMEKYKKENNELKSMIQILKLQNQEKNTQNRLQLNSLTQELEDKDDRLRKLTKRAKRNPSSSRIYKSISESTFTPKSHRLKNSDVQLNRIVAQVVELQDSNNRVGQLISNNTRSTIATSRFFTYGL